MVRSLLVAVPELSLWGLGRRKCFPMQALSLSCLLLTSGLGVPRSWCLCRDRTWAGRWIQPTQRPLSHATPDCIFFVSWHWHFHGAGVITCHWFLLEVSQGWCDTPVPRSCSACVSAAGTSSWPWVEPVVNWPQSQSNGENHKGRDLASLSAT